jgi:hypothetical protein
MKRLLALLSVVIATISIGVPAAQAFTSVKVGVVTASATVGGTPIADFTLTLRDVTTPISGPTRTQLNWSGVTASATGWKIADQLIVLNSTVTDRSGGVQIYTDNKSGAGTPADPQFVDPSPADATNSDSNGAGLIYADPSGKTAEVLPMAWSVQGSTKVVGTSLLPVDPNAPAATGPASPAQWLYMSDKGTTANIPSTNTSAFANGADFVTMINALGIHAAQGPTGFFSFPDGQNSYVYLQTNFAGASASSTYLTKKLTVEAFTQ